MVENFEELQTLAEGKSGIWNGKNRSGFFEISIPFDKTVSLLEVLYRDKTFWFDHLISISAEHLVKDAPLIRLHYHLQSITRDLKIEIITEQFIDKGTNRAEVFSVSHIWKSANWHERETAELFGVTFLGHPDSRRLLLPSNWEGFPLRKDYQPQEIYHGVKVKF